MRENLAGDYYLVSDITFPAPGTEGLPGEGFEPVGRDTNKTQSDFQGTPFTGKFDGNGHTIRNFSIQRPDESYVGLFGKTQSATVSNVRLSNVNIQGAKYVGSIVGSNHGGTVSGSVERGSVRNKSEAYTGGLVGFNSDDGNVMGSVNISVVGSVLRRESRPYGRYTIGGFTGGLVGRNNGGTVQGYAAGTVDFHDQVPEATADISAIGYWIGGLVGGNFGGTVVGYSSNTVSGSTRFGGLVGENNGGDVIGYGTGRVLLKKLDPTGNTSTGGLVGYNTNSARVRGYFTGEVINNTGGGTNVGSLVGRSSNSGSNVVTGYSRGTVNRTLGSLVRDNNGTGHTVQADTSTPRSAFDMFTVGSERGEWSFPQGQQWPGINLGTDPIFANTRQPIES